MPVYLEREVNYKTWYEFYFCWKDEVHPITDHEGPERKYIYSSTLSLTLVDRGGWSTPHSGRFTPGKTRYPFCRRLGGPQGRSGRVRKIPPPRILSPDRPARSESQYRLSSPGPYFVCIFIQWGVHSTYIYVRIFINTYARTYIYK